MDNSKIVYPRIDKNITVDELNKNYVFSSQEIAFIMQHVNMTASAIGFALLFIMVQKLKYFVLIKDCPPLLIEHVAKAMGFHEIPSEINQYDVSGTRWRHINIIREYIGITEPSLQEINNITINIAKTKNAVEDVINKMLIKQMRQMHNTAKQKLLDYKIARFDYADELIGVLCNVVKAFAAFTKKLDRINAITPYIVGNTEDFLTKCTEFNAYKTGNYLPFLLSIYAPKRKIFLSLLFNLKLKSPYKDIFVTQSIAFIKNCYENNLKQAFPKITEIRDGIKALPIKWQQIITGMPKDADFKEIELLPFELYILTKVTQELRSGDLFIVPNLGEKPRASSTSFQLKDRFVIM